MSDAALFASALTVLIDDGQSGVRGGGGARRGEAEPGWRWDAAERRWAPREGADALAQFRALLLALAGAEASARRDSVLLDRSVAAAVAQRGLVLGADRTWVRRTGERVATEIDAVADVCVAADEELPLPQAAAFAPGRARASAFRCAQDHHQRDLGRWFARPDAGAARPDTEDDVLAQLLKLADQQALALWSSSDTS